MTSLSLIDAPSPNFDERRTPLDMLVLHYTGMESGQAALDRLCDPQAKVSAHYLIEEDGRIFRLVSEDLRAWHAGVSRWREQEDLNSRSIGIEIVNGGHDFGLPVFPPAQIDAVIALCRDILARHDVPQVNIVGHSDIAPERKQDPGELFPWRLLSEAGIGLWPDERRQAATDMALDAPQATLILEAIGYALNPDQPESLEACVRAFQRRWRPDDISGLVDDETLRLLSAVAAKYASYSQ